MKRSVIMMAIACLMLALILPLAQAHTSGTAGPRPASQDDKAKEEYELYKQWYDANNAKDFPKAMQYAKQYLEKFPSGQYVSYLKQWIPQVQGILFEQARNSKNTAEMLRIAREVLAEDPDNLDYIYLLAIHIRRNHMSTQNFSYTSEAAEFTQKAINLIEAGKIPKVVAQKDWKQNAILAYFTETLGKLAENSNNTDKALEYYAKAGGLDPSQPTHFFDCGRLYQKKYVEAYRKYTNFSEEDRAAPEDQIKPEVKAAFDDVNKQVDKVIDCWARFMALTATKSDWNTTRDQVNGELTKLYNYRHPDTPDGLQKLIDQYRTGAPSASGNGNESASTKP